jgi:hypothetical protein
MQTETMEMKYLLRKRRIKPNKMPLMRRMKRQMMYVLARSARRFYSLIQDFLKLPIHIGNPNNLDTPAIGEKAILDTGTKGDWISQTFYNELRDMGVRSTKLSAEELDVQYRDFNGKKFQATAKVDLTIQTEEFKGFMKCRTMRFLVASKATFTILFGRDTIRKHGFFTRSKRDTDGEEVLIGVHDELSEGMSPLSSCLRHLF